MSRPGGPYRDEQDPRRQPRQPQGYPQEGYQQGYPPQPGHDQGYDQGSNQGYDQGGYPGRGYQEQGGHPGQRGYPDQRGYQDQRGYPDQSGRADQRGYGTPPQSSRPAPERPAPREREGGGFRLPGLGLLLSLVGLVVQILSFTVLPWVYSAGSRDSRALPAIWDLATNFDAHGFSGAYVVLFSYPLAVLGILLSLVAVIESAAMKVIWAVLAIIGIAVLALRFGPFGELFTGGSVDFSRQEITYAVIALAALVVVIFMLKMAMSTFRRLAGLVLLVIAGVHIAAVSDLTDGFGFEDVQLGAYGPAVGYVLAAAAAFIGPKRLA
jgi:hypothetical protein